MSRLKIAIQKSGRLHEDSLKLLKDSGIAIENGKDQLKVTVSNFPLEIFYLRNSDIPQYLEDGVVDIAIIGESGSGKSTLLKILYGEYDLIEGHVFWKDEEILGPKYNLVVGHDFMKYVAQEFDLMPFITVEENIGKFLSNFYPEASLS